MHESQIMHAVDHAAYISLRADASTDPALRGEAVLLLTVAAAAMLRTVASMIDDAKRHAGFLADLDKEGAAAMLAADLGAAAKQLKATQRAIGDMPWEARSFVYSLGDDVARALDRVVKAAQHAIQEPSAGPEAAAQYFNRCAPAESARLQAQLEFQGADGSAGSS